MLINKYKDQTNFKRCKIWAIFIFVSPPLLWAVLMHRLSKFQTLLCHIFESMLLSLFHMMIFQLPYMVFCRYFFIFNFLSQFLQTLVSFVTISVFACLRFNAMLPVRIYPNRANLLQRTA